MLHCTALYCIACQCDTSHTHAAYMCILSGSSSACAWFTGPRAVHHYLQLALPIDRDPHISTYGRPSSSHPSYPSNTCCCSLRLELSNATNPWRHASHFAFYRIRSLLLLVGTYVTTGKPVFAVRSKKTHGKDFVCCGFSPWRTTKCVFPSSTFQTNEMSVLKKTLPCVFPRRTANTRVCRGLSFIRTAKYFFYFP
jgi:hypothetical protein